MARAPIEHLRTREAAFFARLHKDARPTRLATTSLRLAMVALAAFVLAAILPHAFGHVSSIIAAMCATALVLCLIGLAVRWTLRKLLWTVRSRLIVTCLLLGLAPLILLPVLGGIAAYLFCGQFATRVALGAFESALTRVQEDSANVLALAAQGPSHPAAPGASIDLPELQENGKPVLVEAWRDDKLLDFSDGSPSKLQQSFPGGARQRPGRADHGPSGEPSPFATAAPPAWLKPGFANLVETPAGFFLCAASGASGSSHALLTLACSHFGAQEVALLAAGLGTVRIMPHMDVDAAANSVIQDSDDKDSDGKEHDRNIGIVIEDSREHAERKAHPKPPEAALPPTYHLEGGILPAAANFFDIRVYFSAPMQLKEWPTGADDSAWLFVTSRPRLLYRHLFSSSSRAGSVIRIFLIMTGSTFAALELFAALMAVALSRTITRSIADLYQATQQIDKGDLDHKIPVRRRDQLSALAASFNTMTASLKTLLKDQREKDRMQNELNIAREVQETLFPRGSLALPGLELYGVCEAARTIGGDYYDFIPNGSSQLYLALGDISGKGISAALLMASLHSAVRAYCEDGFPDLRGLLPRAELADAAKPRPGQGEALSPGRLLALLNRHLYASTQPEKYATLFFAHYDSATRLLTYSNGGHLPPLLLSAQGEVRRLDCGGVVIGLLDNLEYQEATIAMLPGDLLVLYSDGLTEPERDTAEFGEERLIQVVRDAQQRPLPEIAAHTFAAVHSWIGEAEQPDDMTVVLARLD